jgi:hypothetical protein
LFRWDRLYPPGCGPKGRTPGSRFHSPEYGGRLRRSRRVVNAE